MLVKLLAASQIINSGFNVYTPETMPTKWFFTNPTNQRLSPIFMVPDVGWVITSHHQFEVEMGGVYRPKGAHGYDNYDVRDKSLPSCNRSRLIMPFIINSRVCKRFL
jgi:hypothetical protein